jgi:hypothetical protein
VTLALAERVDREVLDPAETLRRVKRAFGDRLLR